MGTIRMCSIRMRTTHSGRLRLGSMRLSTVPDSEPKRAALNRTTEEFGERIHRRRLELGLSQEAAARLCGIHWTQFGKVERGQRSLRLETIVRIARGLDIDAGQLVRGLPLPD